MAAARQGTLASLPEHLYELPNGPRIGPISRVGYEPAFDAAGWPFPTGERDSRNVMTVDDIPHKLANPLPTFDRAGVAGQSERVELRAVTVDDLIRIRRARSSPPDLAATRLVQQSSIQALGINPDIDSPRFRRRHFSPRDTVPTRDQVNKIAARTSNIDGISTRKQFHGTSGPGAWMSPRYAARCTELIDIDAHGGRMMSPTRKEPAVESILPASESFELTSSNAWSFEQTPRPHSMAYFVKSLEAEKYAKLLGRPQSRPRTAEFASKISSLKLENLQKRERGWQRSFSAIKDRTDSVASVTSLDMYACDRDWSVVSSEPNSPVAHAHARNRMFRSLSAISTAASDGEGSVRSEREIALSKASRSVFSGSFDEADCKNATWGCPEDHYADYDDNSPKKVPLGIRRVMASMMADTTDVSQSMANQLQAAIGVSMQKLAKPSKNVRTRATAAMHRQHVTSLLQRNASVPSGRRSCNGTRKEDFEDPNATTKRPLPVAVAG